MRSWTYAVITFGFLVGAVSAQDQAEDLKKMQGFWQLVSLEVSGNSVPDEQVKKVKMTIKGNKTGHPGPDGKTEEGILKLDPSKKPKWLDILPGEGGQQTLQGIYSIEGDTLKICGAMPGNDRPTEFKGAKGVVYMVYEREKK